MAASGGWSETAGPWVKPEEAMKKVVWSETRVQARGSGAACCRNPPSMNGRFRNIPVPPDFDVPRSPPTCRRAKPPVKPEPQPPDPTFYADTAVLAYRVPDDEVRMADLQAEGDQDGGPSTRRPSSTRIWARRWRCPFPDGGEPAWIQYEFAQPFRVQACRSPWARGIPFFGATPPVGQCQTSRDGTSWVTLLNLPGPVPLFGGFPVRTYALARDHGPALPVRFPPPAAESDGRPVRHAPGSTVRPRGDRASLRPRVHQWEDKARLRDLHGAERRLDTPGRAEPAIARANVVDLTSKMGKDGRLDWDAPAGNVGGPAHGLLAHRREEPPRHARGDRLRGRQAEPQTRGSLPTTYYVRHDLRRRMGPLLRQEPPLPADGQLGGAARRTGPRTWSGVPRAARLRPDAVPARAHRPRRGERGRERPLPLGLPPHASRTSWPRTTTRRPPSSCASRHRPLRGGRGRRACSTMPEDALLNKSQVDIPMGEFWTPLPGQQDNGRVPRRRARGGVGGARLRQDAGGGGVLHLDAHGPGLGYDRPSRLKPARRLLARRWA